MRREEKNKSERSKKEVRAFVEGGVGGERGG